MLTHYNQKYSAMSLVEMLITIGIMSIVLLVVAVTLTSMIKASAISNARTLSRSESEFIFEIISRNLRNAKSDDVYIYQVSGRSLASNGSVISEGTQGFDSPIEPGSGLTGNEVHVRPSGSDTWVCIAWYPANAGEASYIVRGNSSTGGESCLANASPVPLNEDGIIVTDFAAQHYVGASGNATFIVDLEVIPLHWIPGPQSEFKPEYRRQLVVSTEKLTF